MNQPDQNERLPITNQLLYAAGSMGSQLLLQTIAAWLVYFYAPPADVDRTSFLPLMVVGAILGLGRIVDGITDPLVGYWNVRIACGQLNSLTGILMSPWLRIPILC